MPDPGANVRILYNGSLYRVLRGDHVFPRFLQVFRATQP
jgi:hypothetical protein